MLYLGGVLCACSAIFHLEKYLTPHVENIIFVCVTFVHHYFIRMDHYIDKQKQGSMLMQHITNGSIIDACVQYYIDTFVG